MGTLFSRGANFDNNYATGKNRNGCPRHMSKVGVVELCDCARA